MLRPCPFRPIPLCPRCPSWGGARVLGEGLLQPIHSPQGTGVGHPRTWGLSALGAARISTRWACPCFSGGRGSVAGEEGTPSEDPLPNVDTK